VSRADRVALVVVVAVTFGVFVPALGAGLLDWDDAVAIFDNPHIRAFDWRWMFGELGYNPRYMPLTWLDWTITYRLFGLRPLAYHLGNVVLHAANAGLVYVLVARLTEAARARVAPWRAAAATALGTLGWAIHPLRVEPVTWATDRSYSQSLLFALVAVLLHLSWVRTRQRWRYVLAVTAFAAAVLSYPIVLGVAGVLFVLDVAPLGRPFDRARVVEKLPYLLLAAGALALTVLARAAGGTLWSRPEGLGSFGVGARVMQAAYVWAYYAWRPLVPVGLAPVYTTLVDFRPGSAPFVASAGFVVVLTVAAWALRKRAPWLLAAWGAHLILLVPALGLTERPHYTNDRYDHLAGIVVAVLVAAALVRARATALVLVAAVVAGLGVLSVEQQAAWHDDVSLYVHTIDTLGDDPYRVDLYERLGELYTRRGDLRHAALAWDGAIAANPSAPRARWERARIRLRRGDLDGAVADCDALLAARDEPAVRELRGVALGRLGRFDEAIADLARAAPARPGARRALEATVVTRVLVGISR